MTPSPHAQLLHASRHSAVTLRSSPTAPGTGHYALYSWTYKKILYLILTNSMNKDKYHGLAAHDISCVVRGERAFAHVADRIYPR